MTFAPNLFNLFTAFQQHASLLRRALELLGDCITDSGQPLDVTCSKIQNLERKGDEILRSALRELDFQFGDYPPKADARRLFYRLDRILDAVKLLAGRMAAYRLGRLPDPAEGLMNVIRSCATALDSAIKAFGEAKHFPEQISGMTALENQADQIYMDAIRELFESEIDLVRLIKLNETYGLLERIVNLFEDCIQAMEDAALKNFDRS